MLPTEFQNRSLSHGTMRTEDLIHAFMGFLDVERVKETFTCAERDTYRHILHELAWTTDGDERQEILHEEIWRFLNEIAPAGCAFGSHEGDGSDYGFWLVGPDHACAGTLVCPNCQCDLFAQYGEYCCTNEGCHVDTVIIMGNDGEAI